MILEEFTLTCGRCGSEAIVEVDGGYLLMRCETCSNMQQDNEDMCENYEHDGDEEE